MIYFSCLKLNARDKSAQRDLRDFYQMHKTLARAFGNSDQEQREARVLFRFEESDGRPIVLVQSKTAPNWSTLPDGYCLGIPRIKDIEPALSENGLWSFRLRANPTKSDAAQKSETRDRGKRVGIYREEERIQWLHRKAAANGFTVLEARVQDEGRIYSQASKDEAGEDEKRVVLRQVQSRLKDGKGIFSAARFEGVLRVDDGKTFSQALENGIGAGKAFGFGLLSLKRA